MGIKRASFSLDQRTKDRAVAPHLHRLDPAVAARLEAASTGLAEAVAFETAQAETLTAIAAKNDEPLPPPVEPTV